MTLISGRHLSASSAFSRKFSVNSAFSSNPGNKRKDDQTALLLLKELLT